MEPAESREPIEQGLGTGKLAWIEACLDQIRTLARPQALRTDLREQRFIAYTLQIAMQAAKDAAAQIAEAEGRGDQRTGARAFQLLAENGWIPASLLPRLRTLNRFRQTLIHKADPGVDLIEEALEQAPGILQDFVRAIRPNVQPLADLSSLETSLSGLGFGRLEGAFLLSCLFAIHGQAVQVDQEALSETRSVVRKAVAFLRAPAQFPHVSLLASIETLPILAAFFHRHPSPSPRTGQLLTRWIWRRAVDAAGGREEMPLEQAAQSIVPGREDLSIRNLLAGVCSSHSEQTGSLAFDLSSAQTRLHLAALAALRPREIATGEELDVAALCERPGGPASPLVPGAASLANRILHPGVDDLRSKLAEMGNPEILRSHLLSAKSQAALRQGDLPAFLDSRAQDLQAYVASFLHVKADWNAADRDRPALSSLIVADE
jgi:uncharacterized protein YutE (UPF0331/DUF86 family)